MAGRPSLASKSFEDLSAQHRQAIEMAVQGCSFDEIASACGITSRNVANWVGAGGVFYHFVRQRKQEVAQEAQARTTSFAEKMALDGQKAWEELVTLATSQEVPFNVKISALDSILDRAGPARNSKTESKTELKTVTKADRESHLAQVLQFIEGKKDPEAAREDAVQEA